jgi:hypothetical protein
MLRTAPRDRTTSRGQTRLTNRGVGTVDEVDQRGLVEVVEGIAQTVINRDRQSTGAPVL